MKISQTVQQKSEINLKKQHSRDQVIRVPWKIWQTPVVCRYKYQINIGLKPTNDSLVYIQFFPKPLHVKEDVLVVIALSQRYGSITVPFFQKMHVSNLLKKA